MSDREIQIHPESVLSVILGGGQGTRVIPKNGIVPDGTVI